jgi:hypothetical protein
MSAFNSYAAESADSQNEDVTAVPEDETATSELADATAEQTEVAQEDDIAEQLGEEQEQVEDLGEAVAQESGGLTPQAARMLNLSLRRIVGKKHASKIIATENYTSSRSLQLEAKQIALEGIKDTLKAFWEAIKAQLKKFYNKVKTFFVKVFSAARKLSERAKKLQDKASETVGSIEEKSFSFSQTKAISVDGKYNNPSDLTSGLNEIYQWMKGNLTVKKSEDYENVIEKTQGQIEKSVKDLIDDVKGGGKGFGLASGGKTSISAELDKAGVIKITPLGKMSSPDSKLVDMYKDKTDNTVTVGFSKGLPGGKSIVSVSVSKPMGGTSIEGLTAAIKEVKQTRLLLGNDKYTPRDVTEGDVKTLTTSQIDKVCDDVIEIAEISYTYEKAWERRDKFQSKLEREVDQIVKEVDQEDHDKVDSTVQRAVRQYAEAFTASVRRRTTFESQFIGYALNTASAMLNYSERSLAQHKAK